MTNRQDPDQLPRDYSPAKLYTGDGKQKFVANTITKDNGWLYVVCWNGKRLKYPPESVNLLELVETETVEQDDSYAQRIVNDDLREQAKQDSRRVVAQ